MDFETPEFYVDALEEMRANYYASLAEDFYVNVVDNMAELIISYGRDRVMSDVSALVMQKLSELESELSSS